MFEFVAEWLEKLFELLLVTAEFGVGLAIFTGISFAVLAVATGFASYVVGAATKLAKKLGLSKEEE